MLKTVEKNFRYHEFYTDSENFVKDVAKLLALGYATDAIADVVGNIIKPSLPIIDSNWTIVYPAIDKRQFPEVEDWARLTPEEYEKVTKWQLTQITDTAIIKTKTLPKKVTKTASVATFGFDSDLDKDTLEMYLEVYMPPYLCDTETDDPLLQRDGYQPRVLDPKGFNEKDASTTTVRNYYHAFFRIFDKLNEKGNGPLENDIDPLTNEILRWNSRSSEWSKLSWYNDFEDKYVSELVSKPERGMLDGSVRMPVLPGISLQTKIKLWANVNRDRLVLACMGSPNIDFSDERYLIGCAYVGAIDSFDFSINDTAGNFGIFTTSSSVPSIGETTTNTRNPRWAGVAVTKPNPANPSQTITDSAVPIDGPITYLDTDTAQKAFNLKNIPSSISYETAPEFSFDLLPQLQNVPKDSTQPGGGEHWGTTYAIQNDARVTITLSYIKTYEHPFDSSLNRHGIEYIRSSGGTAVVLERFTGKTPPIVAIELDTGSFKMVHDEREKKNVKIVIDTKAFMKKLESTLGIPVATKEIKVGSFTNFKIAFKLQTQYETQTGGVKRDSFGNIVSVDYRTRYGKNSANGTTDFAMYHTFGKDYFQKHHFMFTSTEEFMQKELYGKSVYTSEYFADRIKIVHGSEGPRGILKAMITVDTSSLYPFDELIVNKDFKKYEDEPEELFVYLPITAPYCPFSNSPNGRHGIGILKEIRYPVPESDEDYVAYAIRELERKYGDMKYIVDDVSLISASEYGIPITWESTDSVTIQITGEE